MVVIAETLYHILKKCSTCFGNFGDAFNMLLGRREIDMESEAIKFMKDLHQYLWKFEASRRDDLVSFCLHLSTLITDPFYEELSSELEQIFESQYKYSKPQEDKFCSICLDEDKKVTCLIRKCRHEFHESCLTEWLKKDGSCPYCRSSLQTGQKFSWCGDVSRQNN